MGRCRVVVMCVLEGSAVVLVSYCLRRGESWSSPFTAHLSPNSAMLFLPPSPWSKGVHETVYIMSYILSSLNLHSIHASRQSRWCLCFLFSVFPCPQPLWELLGMRFPKTHAPLPPSSFVRAEKRMAGRSVVP